MSVVLIRSVILYILVIFAVRLMGKRQLGELQPSELVITILVSNIATLPLEDVNIPLMVGVTPILALVCFEVLMSWAILKSPKFRKIVSGSPKIVISNGIIDNEILSELRMSVDDLMMSLRTNDIFNPEEVQYAIVETTGSVSVMKKPSFDTPTKGDLGISQPGSDPPIVIISDGKIIERSAQSVGMKPSRIKSILKEKNLDAEDIFIMTADSSGACFIAEKKGVSQK